MKKSLLTSILILNLLVGFAQIKKVVVQPLGNVSPQITNLIKESIQNFYGFNVIIEKSIGLTDDLLAPSKNRYDGKKILMKFNSSVNKIVVTNVDITTNKGNIKEWGVFGLAAQPGKICVISTFRLKRNVSNNKFQERLVKVSLHEIGHNLGLSHCNNDMKCLMNDAKGTSKQVDNEKVWLCDKCRKKLK